MQQTQRTQIILHLAMFFFLKEALFATSLAKNRPIPESDSKIQIMLHQLSGTVSASCHVVV